MTEKTKTRPAFYVFALLIPVLFLALIEGLLRITNYGEPIPAFVEVEHMPGFSQPNPKLIERYFADPELAPNVSPDTVYFRTQKSPDSFRIVIQGGSTAAGFPYGRFGSLQGMLKQRLKNAYPNKNIEIINTAMAAVNTYTLLDIQDEIIDLEPDLVLIYTGHNEYLGVLGAGSVLAGKGSHWATRSYLALKSFRLFQMVESLTTSAMRASSSPSEIPDNDSPNAARSTMALAAKGKQIPFEGDVYQRGIEQFESNLAAILSVYQDAEIPVHIGNLVSIEKDLAPFSKGQTEQDGYHQAQQLLTQGDVEQAQQAFIKARDLDQLRFRAPSAFNRVIKGLAKEYDAQLVDIESEFRANSPQGILDASLFLEHVHPTADGYFLLGEAFYESIAAELGAPDPNPSQKVFSRKQAAEWRPLSEVDLRYADEKIRALKNGFPFTDSPQKLTRPVPNDAYGILLLKRLQGMPWLDVQKALVGIYQQQNNISKAALTASVIADAMVIDADVHNSAANLFRQINQTRFAYYHQKQALALVDEQSPEYERFALNFAFDLFLAQQHEQSLALLKSLRPNSKQPKRVEFFINKVSAALEKQTSKPKSADKRP